MATISTEISRKDYVVSVLGETVFTYNFLILDAAHWRVYVNGALRTDYTVTGVGNPSGGTIVFGGNANLLVGEPVLLVRQTPMTQLTDLVDHDFFNADTLEDAYTKLTLIVQELRELLKLYVQIDVTQSLGRMPLLLPPPGALQVFGWNALGTAITLFNSTILQITPDAVSGLAWGKSSVIVPSVFGAVQLAAPGALPGGVIIFGATARMLTPFGATTGLTTWSLGTDNMIDRYGSGLSRSGPVTNVGQYAAWEPFPVVEARDLFLTADTGTFDGTGSAKLTTHFFTLTPDA